MKAFLMAASASLFLALGAHAQSPTAPAPTWKEGVNYFLVSQPHKPEVGLGKVEVTEAFSYACPACNQFQPTMRKLKSSLPGNVVVDYLPAAFNTVEDWPMFQLAYLTAQALGVDLQNHDAMFDAVWGTGELAVTDASHNLKSRMPTIEDAAKFYNKRANVPVEKFLATAKSFAVDMKVRSTDTLIKTYQVDRTPTIIVNGKYRLFVESAGGSDQLVELVKFLVQKESAGK